MSAIGRLGAALRTVVSDPVGRRAYVGRLKWLLRGSGSLHAHSLEYRAGLTGRWRIPAERRDANDELVMHCPEDCSVGAPLSHLYERRFVYDLDRTIVSTSSGAAILCAPEEPPFFVRESITWPFESILSHGLEVPEVDQASERIPGPCAVFPTTSNYYHWLIEDLPTVLRAHQASPDAPLIAFQDGITSRHRIVADALGVGLQPTALVAAVDRQVLAGRSSDSWFPHPVDTHLLGDFGRRLTGHDGVLGTDSIYVSRRSTTRPLPDEALLEQALTDRGFTVLRLEDMEWTDQIRAFQRASRVVAPHGAGLANLVFTPPGAEVVEITFGLHYNRCFEWLCHVAGHSYTKVDGDAGSSEPIPAVLDLVDHRHR